MEGVSDTLVNVSQYYIFDKAPFILKISPISPTFGLQPSCQLWCHSAGNNIDQQVVFEIFSYQNFVDYIYVLTTDKYQPLCC